MREGLRWFAAATFVCVSACKGGGDSSGPVPGAAPGSGSATPSAASGDVTIAGAGASFPNPLYAKWIQEYQAVHKTVKINYQSVGSGAGIKAISDKTVDFGASDAPMTDEQQTKAGGKLVHVPMTIGAVVLTYNVPGAPDHLKMDQATLAGIFLGEIKKWNDPKIVALNADAKLPATDIGVVYRSDGSGTTAVFTDYLSHISEGWKSKVGSGTSVKWPTGIGANKNDGVANQVKQTPGAIGYVELAFAIQTKQPVVVLKNHAGKFVEPTLEGITAAASGAASHMPEDLRVSIVDAEGDTAYPISAFTYVLVYEDMPDAAKAKALVDFLWWGVHDGQKYGPTLHYATLPAEVVAKDEAKLKALKAGGKPVLAAN
jgi:phosphate transport system substrate-binding protein